MQKQINARLIQKNGLESEWNLATNFIPMKGEIIVYNPDDNYNYARFKIGDGITLVNDLPFLIPETTSETSGLPEVSAADNGSFLRVVNGEWKIVKYNVYDGSVV